VFELTIPIAAAAFFTAVMLRKASRLGRVRGAWRQAAEALGLRFDDAESIEDLQIVGRLGGHQVRLRVLPRQRDGQAAHHAAYELRFARRLEHGTTLHVEGLMYELGKLVGIRDAEVGDPQFDRNVHVKTADLEGLRQWLTVERRKRIRRFLMGHTEASIDDVGLRWVAPYLPAQKQVVVSHIQGLVKMADALVEPTDAPEAVAPGAAAEDGRDAARERSTGRVRRDQDRRSRQTVPAPSKPRRPPVRPRPSDAPAAPHVPAAPDAPDAPNVLRDPLAVAAALFGRSLEGLDASERFEAEYADRPVAWQGTLRRLEKVTVDFVFGDGPFTRATFELHREATDALGSRTLSAVVRLPAEANESLRPRIGQLMAFRGRLSSIDPFSRSLFVAEGAVQDGDRPR